MEDKVLIYLLKKKSFILFEIIIWWRMGFFFLGEGWGGEVTFNLSLINEALINPTERYY